VLQVPGGTPFALLRGGEGWGEVGEFESDWPVARLTLPVAARRVPSLSPRERAERAMGV